MENCIHFSEIIQSDYTVERFVWFATTASGDDSQLFFSHAEISCNKKMVSFLATHVEIRKPITM